MATVLAGLLVGLSSIVRLAGPVPGDEPILVALYDAFGTDLDDAMVLVGAVSDSILIAAASAIVALVLLRSGRRHGALTFIVLLAIAMVGNVLLKLIIRRGRPDVRFSPESVSTFSFPSGHVTNTSALLLGMLLVLPAGRTRTAVAMVGGAVMLLVAFSRLAIGVHFPSDVVGSWLWVGLVWAALHRWLARSG